MSAILGPMILLAALLLVESAAAESPYRLRVEGEFRTWLEKRIWPRARKQGVSRATFTSATAKTRLNWDIPELHPPGVKDNSARFNWQAEFRSGARYFDNESLTRLVGIGRAKLKRWRRDLDIIEQKYGVPRGIIMAIWARETAYGRATLPHDAIRVLATLSFMGRNKPFFERELLAALQIYQQGHISIGKMKSSWAGALGYPQFLPSKFLLFAVDYDGDGRRDIWRSVPDTLASIGNYLKSEGWRIGRDWGFEARIPKSVSCTGAGPHQGMAITQWVKSGVKRVSGRPFPAHERGQRGFLMMPAGRYGPAFIATETFYVLKTYNESDLYALFIGHLADRYGANRSLVGRWSPVGGFTRGQVRAMQLRLEKRKVDVGGADGLIGFKTRIAVGQWQRANKRPVTCFPTTAEVKRIK